MDIRDAVVPPIPYKDLEEVESKKALKAYLKVVEEERDDFLEANKAIMRLLFIILSDVGGGITVSESQLVSLDFDEKYVKTEFHHHDRTLKVWISDTP